MCKNINISSIHLQKSINDNKYTETINYYQLNLLIYPEIDYLLLSI